MIHGKQSNPGPVPFADDDDYWRQFSWRRISFWRQPWKALKWRRLLAPSMAPGDEIWEFSSHLPIWDCLEGRAGIALVRDGKIVDSITTMIFMIAS
jgi:hypothetical protein